MTKAQPEFYPSITAFKATSRKPHASRRQCLERLGIRLITNYTSGWPIAAGRPLPRLTVINRLLINVYAKRHVITLSTGFSPQHAHVQRDRLQQDFLMPQLLQLFRSLVKKSICHKLLSGFLTKRANKKPNRRPNGARWIPEHGPWKWRARSLWPMSVEQWPRRGKHYAWYLSTSASRDNVNVLNTDAVLQERTELPPFTQTISLLSEGGQPKRTLIFHLDKALPRSNRRNLS